MALIIKDRVKEITTSTGTGAVSLGGASATFDAFQSVMSNGDTTYYAIVHTASGTDEWEVGLGTWNTGNTLTRTTVLAGSNGTSAVTFSSGNKDVFMTYPADKAVFFNADGDVDLNRDPQTALQAATKQYVDTIAAAGIHYHTPVRVEAPSNLTATYDNGTSGVGATLTNSGTQAALVIDGITLATSDRVLVYNQTNAAHNGIYTVTNTGSASTNWVLTRATDADTYGASDPDALGEGDAYFVKEGDTGAGELYVMNTSGVITFGTTNITFTVIAETAVYSAGNGLTLTGTEFAVGAGTGVTVNANNVAIGQAVGTSDSPTFAGLTVGDGHTIGDDVGDNLTLTSSNGENIIYNSNAGTHAFKANGTDTVSFDGSGNITVTGTVDGRDVAADGTKLDGIESGATADQTASEILTALLGVDGASSNLDADLLDGQHGSYYLSTTGTAANASLLNSLASTQFLRSDVADTKTAGDLSFTDNVKAIFGAGSDLEIYHDGSNSIIKDAGTGTVKILASDFELLSSSGTVVSLKNDLSGLGGINLYYAGNEKLRTISTGVNITGNIAVSGSVDGRDIAADGTKLDGIETGATADQTASEILTAIKTVDGSGSGLDADTVDGIHASSFLRSDADDTATGKIVFGSPISAGSSAKIQVGGFQRTGPIMLAAGTTSTSSFNTTNERWLLNNGTNLYASTSSTSYNNKIWTDGNDGAGSGLDADLWDGNQFASYLDQAVLTTSSPTFGGMTLNGTLTLGANVINDVEDIYLRDRIYHVGDTDTWFQFHAANQARIVCAGGEVMEWGSGYALMGDGDDLYLGSGFDFRIFHDGTNNYLRNQNHAAGDIYIQGEDTSGVNHNIAAFYSSNAAPYAGLYYDGTEVFNTVSGGVNVNGDINAVDNIYLGQNLYHEGDTNTRVQFGTDTVYVVAGGHTEITVNTTGVRLGDSGNGYFQPVSGDYGSIQIDGGAHGGYEGYSIGGRAAFLHDNGTETGISDDVNNAWMVRLVHGGAAELYHNGSSKLNTISTGANINGDLNAVDNIYVGANIYHEGDTNTYVSFGPDAIYLVSGGNTNFSLGSGYTNINQPLYNYAVYYEDYDALSGTSVTVNCDTAQAFSLTMTGNTTFTFNSVSSPWGTGFVLELTGNGGTVTWPTSVDWAGGTAPDAPASGETDLLVFWTRDGGTTWYGMLAIDAAA
jgi:hypothetical protein